MRDVGRTTPRRSPERACGAVAARPAAVLGHVLDVAHAASLRPACRGRWRAVGVALVQAALSLVWSLFALAAMVVANRRRLPGRLDRGRGAARHRRGEAVRRRPVAGRRRRAHRVVHRRGRAAARHRLHGAGAAAAGGSDMIDAPCAWRGRGSTAGGIRFGWWSHRSRTSRRRTSLIVAVRRPSRRPATRRFFASSCPIPSTTAPGASGPWRPARVQWRRRVRALCVHAAAGAGFGRNTAARARALSAHGRHDATQGAATCRSTLRTDAAGTTVDIRARDGTPVAGSPSRATWSMRAGRYSRSSRCGCRCRHPATSMPACASTRATISIAGARSSPTRRCCRSSTTAGG